jgi:2-polyprenyl-6-methoxyphenol hydroxylase-like FAD-dependent oxidoreductase
VAWNRDAVRELLRLEQRNRGRALWHLDTGHNRFTWYGAANTGCDHVDTPDGRKRETLRMLSGWHEHVERLLEATDEHSILKNGAWGLAPLPAGGRGRVTLLGDSAPPCTPNLRLGGRVALEDAFVLAKSLARESTPELALRRYESL